MALELYKKKRNFSETPEPEGKSKSSKSKLAFVIQRHKASHLHYDFRLEVKGVLKSWAIPKGPSMNPEEKRLAIMVEDHPYSYKDFEGVIPEGNYGAGTVIVWDNGTYILADEQNSYEIETILKSDLQIGHLSFILKGKKLKGEFTLVKLKTKKENTWLLIKKKDPFAAKVQVAPAAEDDFGLESTRKGAEGPAVAKEEVKYQM